MLQLCDFAAGNASLAERSHVHDAYCCANLMKEGTSSTKDSAIAFSETLLSLTKPLIFSGTRVQINNRADVLVSSKTPISPLTSQTSGSSVPLPDLHPLNFSVSIPKQHFYHNESIYRK